LNEKLRQKKRQKLKFQSFGDENFQSLIKRKTQKTSNLDVKFIIMKIILDSLLGETKKVKRGKLTISKM